MQKFFLCLTSFCLNIPITRFFISIFFASSESSFSKIFRMAHFLRFFVICFFLYGYSERAVNWREKMIENVEFRKLIFVHRNNRITFSLKKHFFIFNNNWDKRNDMWKTNSPEIDGFNSDMFNGTFKSLKPSWNVLTICILPLSTPLLLPSDSFAFSAPFYADGR